MKLLLDADMLLMKCTSSKEVQVEVEISPDVWTRWASVDKARDRYWELVQEFCEYFECKKEDVAHCFTEGSTFRKQISSAYKGNRKARQKPIGYAALKAELTSGEGGVFAVVHEQIEADDALGLFADKLKQQKETYAIVSGDKDLRQIPGRRKWIDQEEEYVSVEAAARMFWQQVLAGDSTDNVPGCPGYGMVTAAKAVDGWDYTDELGCWKKIVRLFEKKGKTEDFALQQAQLVRILRGNDYDFTTQQVTLWNPTLTH